MRKSGHGERVDDVLRGHVEPDRLVNRGVQHVDLARAVGMLDLPHPLLRDNVDLHRSGRRKKLIDLVGARPPEQHQEGEQRGGRPADLEFVLDERRQRAARRGRAATIADGEDDDEREDEKRDRARYRNEREIERVRLRREARGLLGKIGKAFKRVPPPPARTRSPTPPATASSVSAPAAASMSRTGLV